MSSTSAFVRPVLQGGRPAAALQGLDLGQHPGGQKDAEGYWYGDYYGVLSFEVNADLVPNPPQDWADLKKPEYANMVALSGDPRTSNQSILSVFAAGLSASGGDVDKAAEEGLKFFAELNKLGNLVPVGGRPRRSPRAQRRSRSLGLPVSRRQRHAEGQSPGKTIVPKTGVVAGVYIQAISAYAPHPNAAKLWMEHLYSDESQITWLKGYCHPIRFQDLVKRGKVPQELLDKLPPADAYEAALFPSLWSSKARPRKSSPSNGTRWSAPTSSSALPLDAALRAIEARRSL